MNRISVFLLVFIFIPLMTGACSSLQAGLYLSLIDKKNGKEFLKNEHEVLEYMKKIEENPQDYVFKAYSRTGVAMQIKRTKLLTHDFYLITDTAQNKIDSLSFGGTEMAFYSEGAWQMNTDSDLKSYYSYIDGGNKWDVKEITPENGINTKETVKKIIEKINSNVKYYYKDHIKNIAGYDNCNTALEETLTEN